MARDSGRLDETRELSAPERAPSLDRVSQADPADLFDPRESYSVADRGEAIARFKPADAHLPDLSREQADDYIRANADQRPWLAPAKDCYGSVQRVIAAIDQGNGHALERHEGFATEDRLDRRVGALEDPAQLDPELRARGKDSENPEKLHFCNDIATAIDDPETFAAAFARGIQHPEVKAILDRPREPHERRPGLVNVPIEELLGEHGHQHCIGYQLLPIDGDLEAAKTNRAVWVDANPEEREQMPKPQTVPISAEAFRGGTIVFVFSSTPDHQHWEVRTMYPAPPEGNEHQP